MSLFKMHSNWEPLGDQPQAIKALTKALNKKAKYQTLLGVTGGGKTFVMANVIRNLELPALVISHNKTLAAQLYSEFKNLFPENAVEYFVSYYDFYQPEAYIPQRDVYIEKEAVTNDQLDRLRLSATSSLLSRKDTIVIASVSCIYGLGDPSDYQAMMLPIRTEMEIERNELLRKFVDMQYTRNDIDFARGHFRARGDTIEIFPSYESIAIRIEMFGDFIEKIVYIEPVSKEVIKNVDSIVIYPAKHFVMPEEKVTTALTSIETELKERLQKLKLQEKFLEAHRLESRTLYDMEMLREVGYCSGIENYARHFSGRAPGQRPFCLLDYFSRPFVTFVDESHVTIPQINGMYRGDRSRKENLVEYGFRLPSALDNRPLQFEEWEELIDQEVFVSATPSSYELKKTDGAIVEQLIRPTGLLDPVVEVRPTANQVQDIIACIKEKAKLGERVLVTTLTKSLSEDLADFMQQADIKVAYLHCEIDAFDRVGILQDLRRGEYEAVIGINLLREGLDLPEVSLVAILDADRQGFLRSETSLIQTMGRAARNVNARVILYADKITPAMEKAISETKRRRIIQEEYNTKHGITPKTIQKEILSGIEEMQNEQQELDMIVRETVTQYQGEDYAAELEKQMQQAAMELNFELAARLRDELLEYRERTQNKYESTKTATPTKTKPIKKNNKAKRKRKRR